MWLYVCLFCHASLKAILSSPRDKKVAETNIETPTLLTRGKHGFSILKVMQVWINTIRNILKQFLFFYFSLSNCRHISDVSLQTEGGNFYGKILKGEHRWACTYLRISGIFIALPLVHTDADVFIWLTVCFDEIKDCLRGI